MTMLKDFFIVFLLCRHPPSARREEPSRVVMRYVVVSSVILLVLFIDFLFDLTGYIVRTRCSELFFLKLKQKSVIVIVCIKRRKKFRIGLLYVFNLVACL